MVAMYTVAGRQVGSHVLAMATLGVTFGIAALSMGGSKKSTAQGPPINASSKEEEAFITEFMRDAEAEGKAANAKVKH